MHGDATWFTSGFVDIVQARTSWEGHHPSPASICPSNIDDTADLQSGLETSDFFGDLRNGLRNAGDGGDMWCHGDLRMMPESVAWRVTARSRTRRASRRPNVRCRSAQASRLQPASAPRATLTMYAPCGNCASVLRFKSPRVALCQRQHANEHSTGRQEWFELIRGETRNAADILACATPGSDRKTEVEERSGHAATKRAHAQYADTERRLGQSGPWFPPFRGLRPFIGGELAITAQRGIGCVFGHLLRHAGILEANQWRRNGPGGNVRNGIHAGAEIEDGSSTPQFRDQMQAVASRPARSRSSLPAVARH